MIEKMKYIYLTGAAADLDRVTETYLSKAEIQFEYTSKELASAGNLRGLYEANPYAAVYKTAERLYQAAGRAALPGEPPMSGEEAVEYINSAAERADALSNSVNELRARRARYEALIATLKPFSGINFNVAALKDFEFIRYRFGRIPLAGFKQFETYLYDESEILFVFGESDREYMWGAYFACDYQVDKIDSVFSSLHFERVDFPFSMDGEDFNDSPRRVYAEYVQRVSVLDRIIAESEAKLMERAGSGAAGLIDKKKIAGAYLKVKELYEGYEIRKYAAKTDHDYFIFVGWMTEEKAAELGARVEEDEKLVFIIEDNHAAIPSRAPTKLKNFVLFRPFQFFVRLYGLPSYNEIEPTPFVAITYMLLFGIMFADIGQGAVLALLGLFLWKAKGQALGKIMTVIGASSMFFGAVFGSLFGLELYEDSPLSPANPLNVNTFLLGAVGIGVFLILCAMCLNIANHVKKKRFVEMLFHPNGAAGVLFYVSALALIGLTVLGRIAFSSLFMLPLLIPLAFIALREPLAGRIEGKRGLIRGSLGIFAFETFIEAFEVVMSFFTNSVSFIRVGAFALSHACLMGIVRMLAGEASGSLNPAAMVIGNAVVIGIEGLICGIQVLRIEFYELFSRFYEGGGREFKPTIPRLRRE